MKRFLCTILAFLAAFALTACQGDTQQSAGGSYSSSTELEDSQSEPEESSNSEKEENGETPADPKPPQQEDSGNNENSGNDENSGTQGDVETPDEDEGYADIEFPRPQ